MKNSLNPEFDFEKSNIGIADIKADVENHINQFALKANPFPVDVFPEAIQDIIIETNKNLKYPTDFIGSSLLFAASLAIGNTYKVEVRKAWRESTVLYMAMVGRSGTNKSHPLSFALKPFFELDAKTYKDYETLKIEFEQTANLSKKDKKEQGIENHTKPFWEKHIVSDFTPEALASVHKFNKRGIAVYVDELAGWFKNFNRYNQGSAMEFWLSAWSGKPINVDRKTTEPVFIPNPFIGVAGTIQNALLIELAKHSRSQNGFIDRILFVIVDDLKKECWSETEIDQTIIDNWKQIIQNISDISLNHDIDLNPESITLRYSAEAWKLLKEWQIKNTDSCNNAENESIASLYSKLEVYISRIALTLEMMFYACSEGSKKEVSVRAVKGAIALIEYFRNNAITVNAIINNYDPLERLPEDKRKLYQALPDTFTTEIGLQKAVSMKIAERTFSRFIKEKEFFKRIKRGEYEKCI